MNIAKRIFIGVAIAMIVWFLKSEVFALTVDSRLQYQDNNQQTQNTSYVSAGTLMTLRPSTYYTFGSIFTRFSQTFNGSSTYRIEFQYQTNSNFFAVNDGSCPYGYSISSGMTILTTSCIEQSNRYAYVTITFSTTDSSSFATIGLKYNNRLFTANTQTSFIVVANSWTVTNIDSTYEAITNNTTVIGNSIEGLGSIVDIQTQVISSIQDLLNDFIYTTIGDESATTYSGSYSGVNVNGYDNAHLRGTGAGAHGISNSNQMSLDFDSYEQGSTTIWDFLSRLLNCHSEFILYFINILTLGFIRVVLNR